MHPSNTATSTNPETERINNSFMTFNKLAAKIAKRDGIHQNRKEIKKGSEIATDVHLHHIAGHGVVLAFFLNMFFEPPDAIVCA